PYTSPAFLGFVPVGSITTFTDVGASNNVGVPPSITFTLSLNSIPTGPIAYTGIPVLDIAAVQAALSPAYFTAAGFAGGTATVTEPSTGIFVITFGGTLTGATQPIFQGNLTSGVAVLSVTSGSGTIVESGAALVLETSL